MFNPKEKIITFLPPESIELEAMEQIENTASMSFIFKHVAVMPDTHYGKGSTVGTVLATKGAIIPAAVGVDIGCGMIAVKTNLTKEQLNIVGLNKIRKGIEQRIPMSAGHFNTKISESMQEKINELENLVDGEDMDKKFGTNNWRFQLGTLGGGNHFIEICLDEKDIVWITLHSGSRGIGNKIGMYFISEAQKLCKQMMINLPDTDLAYLPENTELFDEYIKYMRWAQHFALLNREEMMDRVLTELSYDIFGENGHQKDFELERINCHHNFTQQENHFGENVWITRKGAIQAREKDKGMIPGSMGTKSYIVSGLENKMSFNSAPHGAGRRMSRKKASAQFTLADLETEMVGIEHRSSEALIDEIPQAYKDIEEVMENAKELVKIEATLKQILNVKGD